MPIDKERLSEIAAALEEVTQTLVQLNTHLRHLDTKPSQPMASRQQAWFAEDERNAQDGRSALDSSSGVAIDEDIAPRAVAAATSDEIILRNLGGPIGLASPVEQLITFRNARRPMSRPRYWAVINFELNSRDPRLFLFDLLDENVTSYLCAHGRGSEGSQDDGFAEIFSNEDGSNCSSLGIYLCAETYSGDNGYSMRLDGQEPTNFNARHRAIVMHGADYVSDDFVRRTGRIGRSLGCPAIEQRFTRSILDALKEGSLLIIWKE